MESVGDHPAVDSKSSFKQHVYLPVLDSLLSEMTKRFDSTQFAVMRGTDALNPSSEHFADLDDTKPFAGAYNADISDLQHQLYQAKRMLERLSDASKKDPSAGGVPASLVSFVTYTARYGEALHELYHLGRMQI